MAAPTPAPAGYDWNIILQALAFAVASLAFILTTLYNIRNNKSKVLFDVFNESRSKSFAKARRRMQAKRIAGEPIDIEEFKEYSFYLNHIGLLLYHKYVDVEEIYQLFGGSIIETWELLEPSIMVVRTSKRYAYQFHFQYLVAQLLEYRQHGDAEIREIMSESAQIIKSHSLPDRLKG